MKQTLSKIHARFRQLRNGEVADNLRMQGVSYHLAWGVESYRLKAIAEEVKAEVNDPETLRSLAEYLLAEDVRESKMIATRLYPLDLLTKDKAEEWASGITYTEQADQACMNLFSRVPFAPELMKSWLQSNSSIMLYMALQLALRLDIGDAEIKQRASQLSDDTDRPLWLRTMANNLLL